MSTNENQVGTLRLFCCGGGGINLGSKFAGKPPLRQGIADVQVTFVDTSRSNLNGTHLPEECFLLPDLDGSGKVREQNHEPISKVIPRILVQHPAGDFNVVVFTGSGGTGSVAGPLLVAELLNRGHNVVAVVIGTEESEAAATNTFNTLKSLDHISRHQGKPVLMHFTMHNQSIKRSVVDNEAIMAIGALAYLCSRQNEELDSMDIFRWLNYNTVPRVGLEAQLTMLKVFNQAKLVDEESPECFALAAILKSHDEAHPDLRPAYGCTGYYREGTDAPHNLFFASETASLKPLLNHLEKIAKELGEHKAARQSGPAFVGKGDQISSTGLIL